MADRDQKLIRLKDMALLAGQIFMIASLLGGIGKIFLIASSVEASAQKLKELEPKVTEHDKRMAVSDSRWEQIQRDIQSINRKLERNQR